MSNFNGINCDICGLSVDRAKYNVSNWISYCREKAIKDAILSFKQPNELQALTLHMCEKCFEAAEAAAIDRYAPKSEKV